MILSHSPPSEPGHDPNTTPLCLYLNLLFEVSEIFLSIPAGEMLDSRDGNLL